MEFALCMKLTHAVEVSNKTRSNLKYTFYTCLVDVTYPLHPPIPNTPPHDIGTAPWGKIFAQFQKITLKKY